MVDPLRARRTGFRLMFAGLCGVVVFLQLLPLHLGVDRLPGPEILTLVTFAWVVRRPEYVPVWLIAGISLLADVLYMRPLGLWTALLVLGAEFLRARSRVSREMPFPVEWFLVVAALAAMGMAQALLLALFLVPQPPLSAYVLQWIVSAASYPVAVIATTVGFGVRPPPPSSLDSERSRA